MADDAEKRLLEERANLADFGLLAVEGADLDELLHQAAAEAARSLDVSYVKVLQYLPDEKCFLVRAGVGWRRGRGRPPGSAPTSDLLRGTRSRPDGR